ncbi:D-alanyl-D-alanine carboxypeptidase family protein [Treponema sp.]|uniref:D-alanyl-D-alanine carboxypeptidase family protein n=1 Tax=Treponema sp. TaxID=166 RepID=UPI003FA27BC2
MIKKIRPFGFYLMIAVTALIIWTLGIAVALYIRGAQLMQLPQEGAGAANTDGTAHQHYTGDAIEQVPYRVPALLQPAPCVYGIPAPPAIAARSAVLIDAVSGALLFTKNPDQSIPPASLTKLVAIYTAMQAVERGDISLSETIFPPAEAWAVNMPPGSSLMFLGKNQQLTVEELMRGMAVVSGNDAAAALAIHTAGSVPAFVTLMNKTVAELGLTDTHFEDASGLSEYNRTTARDFARFSAAYIHKYPEHLSLFHSVRVLRYPEPHNMLKPQPTVTQQATNTLLAKLDGCDGLKTGFIYESGFNIALTAQRQGIRFIAVILGGAGRNSAEGKRIREENGKTLIEWAFSHFSTAYAQDFSVSMPVIPVTGAQEPANTTARLPRLLDPNGTEAAFTIPRTAAGTPGDTAAIHAQVIAPLQLSAPIAKGQKIGKIRFFTDANGETTHLAEFPLVSDKAITQGSRLRWKYDMLALKWYRLWH